MKTYKAQGFKDIYERPIGEKIWKYLNSKEAKDRMILTTELGHPAAEGIGDKLLEQFGGEVKDDRVKQATGHMIRHIMEELGFQHDQKSVKCRMKKEVFKYASRYKKKN